MLIKNSSKTLSINNEFEGLLNLKCWWFRWYVIFAYRFRLKTKNVLMCNDISITWPTFFKYNEMQKVGEAQV